MHHRFTHSNLWLSDRMGLRILVLTVSLLFITGALPGCTLIRQAFAPEPLPVLDVRTFNRNVSLRHRVRITYGEKEFSLQTIIERNEDRMVIVGLSSYSTTLFTIRIHRRKLDIESDTDLPIDLERFATDLQWALWPSVADRENLSVRTDDANGGVQRTIFRNNERIATISADKKPPWTGGVTFTRTAAYTMELSLLSREPLTSTP